MANLNKVIRDLFKPDVIKFALHTRSISQWIQASLMKQGITIIEIGNKDVILEYRGCKFKVDERTCQPVFLVYDDYAFCRLREMDIVVDIGAGIGAFSIPASKKAGLVYAVEPLFYNMLEKNIELNNAKNVIGLKFGIDAVNRVGELNYLDIKNECAMIRFSDLVSMVGHIDFLKLDCEGVEWCIKPEELKGIRTIEAELHTFDLRHIKHVHEWEKWLNKDYNVVLDRMDSTRYMLHAELK